MKTKFLGSLIGVLGLFVFIAQANAQRIELLLEDDQLLRGGRSALHAGNLEKAVWYYEKALDRRSLSRLEEIAVRDGLCVTYMYLERFDEAIEQCTTSIELQPNRWEALNNLGTVYLVMGEYDEAILVYDRALSMKSKSKVLNFNMEIAQQRLREARIKQEIEMEKLGDDSRDRQMVQVKTNPDME